MEQYLNESFDMDKSKVELCHIAINNLLKELFEEKISTLQAHHWILGPEDLSDTLVYDFEVEAE